MAIYESFNIKRNINNTIIIINKEYIKNGKKETLINDIESEENESKERSISKEHWEERESAFLINSMIYINVNT